MLEPRTTARICLLQALSPVGRCKTFDASGDGYGRGEGFAVAVVRSAHSHPCQAHTLKQISASCLARDIGWFGYLIALSSTLQMCTSPMKCTVTAGNQLPASVARLKLKWVMTMFTCTACIFKPARSCAPAHLPVRVRRTASVSFCSPGRISWTWDVAFVSCQPSIDHWLHDQSSALTRGCAVQGAGT